MSDKIRVDVTEMTLRELAEATEAAGDTDAPGGQFRNIAAMAWLVKRRTDPEFTYEDALGLTMSELEIVEQSPEVSGADTGAAPLSSLESGTSIRSA